MQQIIPNSISDEYNRVPIIGYNNITMCNDSNHNNNNNNNKIMLKKTSMTIYNMNKKKFDKNYS